MGKIADAIRNATLPQDLKRQLLTLDKQFTELETAAEIAKSQRLKIDAEVEPLKREVRRLKDELEKKTVSHGDPCPFCRQLTGDLQELFPDPNIVGKQRGHFLCSHCGKDYERPVDMSRS